jgi:excisionase family DNA binding protein
MQRTVRKAVLETTGPWRTYETAAAHLNCSVSYIKTLVRDGKLPKRSLDGMVRFSIEDLNALIN